MISILSGSALVEVRFNVDCVEQSLLLGIALARTPEVDGSDADQQQAQIEGKGGEHHRFGFTGRRP